MRGLGLLLLGIWLIGTGLLSLLNLANPALTLILTVVALVAGVLLLMEGLRSRNRMPNSLGIILLSVWLILFGLLPFVTIPSGNLFVA
ncbi:MAG: hypothetical protein R3264_21810, partial [Anaerolineae bacterium]|nr:hypothetical protein [Anaerolineae bacterium]